MKDLSINLPLLCIVSLLYHATESKDFFQEVKKIEDEVDEVEPSAHDNKSEEIKEFLNTFYESICTNDTEIDYRTFFTSNVTINNGGKKVFCSFVILFKYLQKSPLGRSPL